MNSVLLGSDTVPTNAGWNGNDILLGSHVVQPIGFLSGNDKLQGSNVVQPHGTDERDVVVVESKVQFYCLERPSNHDVQIFERELTDGGWLVLVLPLFDLL